MTILTVSQDPWTELDYEVETLDNDFEITMSQVFLFPAGATGGLILNPAASYTVGTPYQLTASNGVGGTEIVYISPVTGIDGSFSARVF